MVFFSGEATGRGGLGQRKGSGSPESRRRCDWLKEDARALGKSDEGRVGSSAERVVWSAEQQRRLVVRYSGRSSLEMGEMGGPVVDLVRALDGEQQGNKGKLSPRLIGLAGHHRGGSTASIWVAAMADVARLN